LKKRDILYKAIGLALAGIVVALAFTVTNTYSWFNTGGDGYGEVTAASREDILADMRIDYRGDMPVLNLKKAKGIDYSPVIFFSVEGEAKDYLLHMDSVKLKNEAEIPIIPNVNLPQALTLIVGSKNEIVGNIRVKHLNEFIDESVEVRLSRDYLLKRYFLNKGVKSYENTYLSQGEKDSLVDLVKDTLIYTGEYLEWETLEWEEDGYWIEKAHISKEQEQLIDIIAPNLLKYNERLYELLNIIIEDLEAEIEKNDILSKENEELIAIIEKLQGEKEELIGKTEKLEGEKEELISKTERLEGEKEELIGKTERLQREKEGLIGELESLLEENEKLIGRTERLQGENEGLIGDIERLEDENRELTERIGSLLKKNEELNSQILYLESEIERLTTEIIENPKVSAPDVPKENEPKLEELKPVEEPNTLTE
jgi:predicted nuclease with TOPRIM domain